MWGEAEPRRHTIEPLAFGHWEAREATSKYPCSLEHRLFWGRCWPPSRPLYSGGIIVKGLNVSDGVFKTIFRFVLAPNPSNCHPHVPCMVPLFPPSGGPVEAPQTQIRSNMVVDDMLSGIFVLSTVVYRVCILSPLSRASRVRAPGAGAPAARGAGRANHDGKCHSALSLGKAGSFGSGVSTT